MTALNIHCPNCQFAVIVTNRLLLGHPARCPQCKTKFILHDPAEGGQSADESTVDQEALEQETLGSEEIRVDAGRIYITIEQIRQWHSEEDVARFQRWIMSKTSIIAANGAGYFLEDYDEWFSLGKPDRA